jgi:subtilisin family serine protease
VLIVVALTATVAGSAPEPGPAVPGVALAAPGDATEDAAFVPGPAAAPSDEAAATSGPASESPSGSPAGEGARPQSVAGPSEPGQAPTPAGEPPKADDVPGEWIVELKPGESPEQVAEEHETSEGAEVHQVYTAAVEGYAATMSDEEAEHVADDPRVARVTRDRMVYAAAENAPTGVRRVGATPTVVPAANVDVDVAIIDTGISAHADLNIAGGRACNGSSYADNNGHGTHVAGTVAARNQNSGIVGVAPGARLWAVKVLGSDGSGTFSQIVCGLDWVRNQGNIEVVNMSLSGSGTDGSCTNSTLHNAICNLKNAGTTIVVAAGNESRNASGSVPAAYEQVVTVSALADFNGLAGGGAAATCRSDVDDTFASFSNYGADVDVIAPGVCILSTSRTGGTATMSGTSMAAPHVAGAAARYKAANPGATPDQVRTHLINTGNLDWNNSDDRDSTKERLIAVGPISGAGTTTTSTSNTTSSSTSSTSSTSTSSTSSTTTTTAPSSITFTAYRASNWYRGAYVELRWSGFTGSTIDVWRRSSTTSTFTKSGPGWVNDGNSWDDPGNSGTWVYKICQLNSTTVCSNTVSVTL